MTITIGKKDTLKHVNNLPLKKLSINKNFILNPNKKLTNNQLFYKININKRSINYKQKQKHLLNVQIKNNSFLKKKKRILLKNMKKNLKQKFKI